MFKVCVGCQAFRWDLMELLRVVWFDNLGWSELMKVVVLWVYWLNWCVLFVGLFCRVILWVQVDGSFRETVLDGSGLWIVLHGCI